MLTQQEIEAYRKSLGIKDKGLGRITISKGRTRLLNHAQVLDAVTMYMYDVSLKDICEYFKIRPGTFYRYLRSLNLEKYHQRKVRYRYDFKKHSLLRQKQVVNHDSKRCMDRGAV